MTRATPEAVAAPADGATLFRVSGVLTPLRLFGMATVIYLIVQPLVGLAMGADRDPWWAQLLQAAVVSGLFVGVMTLLPGGAAASTWIRISDGGLELGAVGCDPILLAWPDVASAEVRRRGLRTILRITPVEMSRVHRAGILPDLPRVRDGAFTADVGLLRPGAGVLRRTLAARGCRPAGTSDVRAV